MIAVAIALTPPRRRAEALQTAYGALLAAVGVLGWLLGEARYIFDAVVTDCAGLVASWRHR